MNAPATMPPLNVSTDHPLMVVDWSVLGYINWFKMKARDYIPESNLELVEFTRNIAGHILYLVERFQPAEIIIAMDTLGDASTWRKPYYAGYYKTAVDFFKEYARPHSWFVVVDKTTLHVHQDEMSGKWFVDKPKKAELEGLNLMAADQFLPFIGGSAPAWLLEQYPDAPKRWEDHPDADGLALAVPTYKGTRNLSGWAFETPKDEWKRALFNVGHTLAPMVGGRAVAVDWAEGDDIVARYALSNSPLPVLIVSHDADLRQVCGWNPGAEIFNPMQHKKTTPTRGEAHLELLCKLVGGDTSDNIPGISLPGRAPFSPVEWDAVGGVKSGKNTVKWVRETLAACGGNFGAIMDLLEKESDVATFWRNLNLVFFGCIPEGLMAQVDAALVYRKPDPAPFAWDKYGLSDARILSIKNKANRDRMEPDAADGATGIEVSV